LRLDRLDDGEHVRRLEESRVDHARAAGDDGRKRMLTLTPRGQRRARGDDRKARALDKC